VCKFEVKKRAFPRGNPGFLGKFFPEKSGKIWKFPENSGFSGKIWENPGNLGLTNSRNLGKSKKFNLNLSFSRKCRGDNSPIFGRFSRFLQVVITRLSICKFTRFPSDF
jgi:hypothetical protein